MERALGRSRQGRGELDLPEQRRRQRQHDEVGTPLGSQPVRQLDREPHVIGRVLHSSKDVPALDGESPRARERCDQAVVAPGDPRHPHGPGIGLPQLIDGNERAELGGIGDEESAQRVREGDRARRGACFAQQVEQGMAGDRRGHRAVPFAVVAVGLDRTFQQTSQLAPRRCLASAHVHAVVVPNRDAESSSHHRRQPETELAGERSHAPVTGVDELAAGFGVRGAERSSSQGQHAASEPLARLDDVNVRARGRQLAGRDQARQTGASDHDTRAAEFVRGA